MSFPYSTQINNTAANFRWSGAALKKEMPAKIYLLNWIAGRSNIVANNDNVKILPADIRKYAIKSKFEFMLEELHEILALEDNWDGYDSVAILPEIANQSILLFEKIGSFYVDKISDIFPNPHGTITIEWLNQKSEKISLEIGKKTFSFFIKNSEEIPEFFDGQDILENVKLLTDSLVKLFGAANTKSFSWQRENSSTYLQRAKH